MDLFDFDLLISLGIVSNLVKGKLLTTIPKWSKEWRVSFDIKPLKKVAAGYSNILHITTGRDCCSYGSRIPAIWFSPNSFNLHISNSINGKGNYWSTLKPLTVNRFTTVVVEQVKINGKYIFMIKFNGVPVKSIINNRPAAFSNVKVYSADPWYRPANAIVKNLHVNANISPEIGINTGKLLV